VLAVAGVVCGGAWRAHLLLTTPAKLEVIADYERIGELTRHTTRALVVDPNLAHPIMYWGWIVAHGWELDYNETLPPWVDPDELDYLIVVGNDQLEVFKHDLLPGITVYAGEAIENIPLSEEQRAKLPPGIAIAEEGHCPPGGAVYPGAPREAELVLRLLVEQHFDAAQSVRLPKGPDRQHGIPHAFGFLYRNTMRDAPPPSIPIFLNVGVPPNQPTLRRCLDLGKALELAIAGLPAGRRVALLASGGLTHFVVDEEFDRRVLQAMQAGDLDALAGLDESWFTGNTAEIKSWLPLVAAMQAQGKRMRLVDYVPCYRTEAGTGQGMAFAYWE